ncbi:MAG: TonB-dependent receptor [Bryobacteraceae bacterium]
MKALSVRLSGFLATVTLLMLPALAQVERASIVGAITDRTGASIAGVEVTVTNEGTNAGNVLTTDATGNFAVVNLLAGSYTVSAQKAGFSRSVYRNFVLQVGQSARLDITLEVGAVEQTVEVVGTLPLLQTENASVGQVISPEPINALPLNGRNFVQLAILAPGVNGLDYAQRNTINSGRRPDELRPGGTTLLANGARNTNNQVLLDGIDNTEMISQTFVVRPSVEGIQEFRVLTNNPGAEYGRAAGAVVVVNTKSGTNRFHGSAFEFLRNSSLDARNFFARPDQPQPPFRLNQYGASLGGPVLLPKYNGRDKTFFFMNWEGYREIFGDSRVVTVPRPAIRQGDFRGVVPNGIYDPLTTRPNPAGTGSVRDRFPNDIIPASRFDPIASRLVSLYPLPQTSGAVNNFVANPKKRSVVERADGRFDHRLSEKDSFFVRYSIDDSRLTIPDTFNTDIGGNEDSFAGPNDVRGQSIVITDIRTFSPALIGDFRFGYTRFNSRLVPTSLTNPVWGDIPGRDASDPFQPTAPIVSPAGYAGLGNARSNPLIRDEDMKQIIANATWQKGTHNLRWGVDLRFRMVSETASPPGESAFGRFNFDNGLTNNPAAPGGTGDAIATMLLGYPARTTRDFFIPGTGFLNSGEHNFYFRDDWRVNNRLTLNLGLHYEVNTPFTERNNYWVNFDPATANLLIAGQNASRTANVNTDKRAFGPRFGFAWQVMPKTVLRGGYGIFYTPEYNFATNIRQFRQVPFGFNLSIIPGALTPANRVAEGFPKLTDFPPVSADRPFGNLRGVTPDFQNLQMQQFNLSLQREISANSVATIGFVSSLGRHLTWARNLNLPDPGPGAIGPRRPYAQLLPDVVNIAWLESSGSSAYTSLQTTFERRFGNGFFFLGNWTWSHGLDNAGGDGGANGPIPQDLRDRNADWGSSASDLRHRVNFAWTYALPFGAGKRYLNEANAMRWILGNWELGGITVMQSGFPFTVTTTGSPTNTGVGGRADVVPGVSYKPQNQSLTRWFAPEAFSVPQPFNWGNAGRNTVRGPATYNFDLTASKKFPLGEARELMFRTEFFNALNTPQFDLPASTVGAGGVGTISATSRANRQLQFALRLQF